MNGWSSLPGDTRQTICVPARRSSANSSQRVTVSDINLVKAVPVIWVYLTGWSNGEGPANFRDDVYNVDNVGEAQVSAQATPAR